MARKLNYRRRPWTEAEQAKLERWYHSKPASEIAKLLRRTKTSVYQQARKIGLHEERDTERINRVCELIKKYNPQGWLDSEIAKVARVERRTIAEWRLKLQLPSNKGNDRHRRKVAEQTRKQVKAIGLKNLAEVRSLAFRQFAEKHGWPAHLSPRAVQIVEHLYKIGPMTKRQIAAVVGMPFRGSKKTLCSSTPGGSYLAELQRAELVIRLPRAVDHGGRGRQVSLYMMVPGACPNPTPVSPTSIDQSRSLIKSPRCKPLSDNQRLTKSSPTTLRKSSRSKSTKHLPVTTKQRRS